ncbi:hypothetical protein [Streptomyces sp. NPDC048473]|uniref:hypothetical protein n=1 Tax=unclassified Streptomyces TaxID=2593676 RepID=UPI00371C30DB
MSRWFSSGHPGDAEVARQAAEAGIEDAGVFAAFNAVFAPNRTESDWLSRDEKQADTGLPRNTPMSR